MSDNPRERFFSAIGVKTNSTDIQQVRRFQVIQEYACLTKFYTSGVYVLPSIDNIRLWQGVIFLKHGRYIDGIYKFNIEIPTDYPNQAPVVTFLNATFHPLISSRNNQLNLTPAFSNWKPQQDFLFQIVAYIKEIFHNEQHWRQEYTVNYQAFSLYSQDQDLFNEEVKKNVLVSHQNLYQNPDGFLLKFESFNSVHRKVLDRMKGKDPNLSENELCESFMAKFRRTFKQIN